MKISQDIEIRTVDGRKFDMLAGETVEVVMGGFSLLDLSLRSASYTTAFQLPRTPTNESILEFASETTRYNRPDIEIFARFGTRDMYGYMKVVSFGKTYSVTLKFTDFINAMSGFELNEIIDDISNPIFSGTSYQDAINKMTASGKYTFFHSYSTETYPILPDMGIFINQGEIISMICVKSGYTSVLGAGVDLSAKFLFCRDWYYEVLAMGGGVFDVNVKAGVKKQYKSISVLLKQLCLANGLYFTVDEMSKTVTFSKIESLITTTPVYIETLTLKEKQLYTGHGRNNTIKYSVVEGITSVTKYATFTADGATSKEALQLEILIPSKIGGIHNLTDVTDLVVASREGTKYNITYNYNGGGYYLSVNTEYLTIPNLAPVYAFMQTVFGDTFIITVEGYINSLQIESIMSGRVIRSVALGGTYFVEALNYNINTGKTVAKLIKL